MSESTNETAFCDVEKGEDMTAFAQMQKFAIEFGGYILTQDAKTFVLPLSRNSREQAEKRLSELISQYRGDRFQAGQFPEPELEALLTLEAATRIRKEIAKFQRNLLSGLRIHDIRSEVLASWLAEIETSNSFSVAADGDSGDSGATDPRATNKHGNQFWGDDYFPPKAGEL
ncbi:hypothetical protein [Tanticharoenia sakaeratensis]|uniref:Uncharacterized protein n=1 Tax=Tanticharoenia sakaeratensis NBRC 103193 TaxID=1231623 RepID=A0A0D6MNG0_9PROT|nr:hypothetical protein [Tanticharoenia sakaeratensis]GAN55224.1 hypothetical protein Tasa_041_019 [Tanticharoenia sakaeratensis NBRC 103193]GBQ23287.1 hypothetical protein AA103193_2362 [Tanticharoenia sakaeratensis NBRC 103193]